MKKPIYWEKAKKFLSKDKAMFKLINSYDGHLITRNNFFYSLSRSIISQQISVKAADSVFTKFGPNEFPACGTPGEVLKYHKLDEKSLSLKIKKEILI